MNARQWLGSIVFTAYLFLSAAVYGLLVLLLAPFGYRAVYRGVLVWIDGALAMLALCCNLRHEVVGLENLPERSSVVLMKHSSAWETIAEFRLFPRQTWVMKRELLWAPVLGWVLLLLKPIAIDRSGGRAAVQQVIDQGTARLGEGLWIIIFPEGTRVPAGQTKRYGLSGTLLAQANGLAVVPVAHNAGKFWPRRGWRKRPGTITVVVGEPIPTAGRDPRVVTNEVQAWIEGELKRLAARDA